MTATQIDLLTMIAAGQRLTARQMDRKVEYRLGDATVSKATVEALVTRKMVRAFGQWPSWTFTLTRAGLAAVRAAR
jgi:hypothetical protein